MDPNVKPQEQARQAAEAQVQETYATEEARCSSCGSPLETDAIFCPECGAARSSGPRQCPACGAEAEGLYCPSCGIEVQEKPCPNCGMIVYGDFCPHCGTSLSPVGDEALRMGTEDLAVEEMSEAEAARIEKSLAEAKSSDTRRFQEILEQRRIVRKEKAYFQEREKRILEFQTKGGGKVVLQSKDDLEMIRNAQQSLSGYIRRKKEREEEQRRQCELEELQRQEARQADADAQRQREAERAALRRKQFASRISGEYFWSDGDEDIVIQLGMLEGAVVGTAKVECPHYRVVCKFGGSYDGSRISIHSTSRRCLFVAPGWQLTGFKFSGRISDDGETLTGFWIHIPEDGYKNQMTFIKQ